MNKQFVKNIVKETPETAKKTTREKRRTKQVPNNTTYY
jgi:hypothetical protein